MKTIRPFNQSNFNANLKPDPFFKTWIEKLSEPPFIEVGCGNGFHSIQLAKNNPDRPIIAIERTKHKFSAFESRVKSHHLKNLYPVFGDATHWLPSNIESIKIQSYYFLYPNPYPKEKQANKRFHRSPFLEYVIASLKQDGSLFFATNEKWFHEECIEYCTQNWGLKMIKNVEISTSNTTTPLTYFEKKYLERGQTCYHLCFQKNPNFDSSN